MKSLAQPGSLREGGWANAEIGHVPPLENTTTYPRGGPLANIQQGPGDAYIPREKTLAKISLRPPPPRGTPCNQVQESHFSIRPDQASAHMGHLPDQGPQLLHPLHQRGGSLEYFCRPPQTNTIQGGKPS